MMSLKHFMPNGWKNSIANTLAERQRVFYLEECVNI